MIPYTLVSVVCPKLPCCTGATVFLWVNDPSLLTSGEIVEATITEMIYLNASDVQYTFEYDDTLLTAPGTPLTPEDIKQICCENCNTQLIRQLEGGGLEVVSTDDTIDGDGTPLDPLTVPPSADADNALTIGTDGQLYVPVTDTDILPEFITASFQDVASESGLSDLVNNGDEQTATGWTTDLDHWGEPKILYDTVRCNYVGQVNGEVLNDTVTLELYGRIVALRADDSLVEYWSKRLVNTLGVGLQSMLMAFTWDIFVFVNGTSILYPTKKVYCDIRAKKLAGAGSFRFVDYSDPAEIFVNGLECQVDCLMTPVELV